ncbi:MAG: amidohydrolase [Candidatus Thorarchaeota archaeon]
MNCFRLHAMLLFMFLLTSPAYISLGGILNADVDLSPEIIFHNGDIITMEQSPSQVDAIAINGETIIAIGDESQILEMAGSNTRIIDLDGRVLLPGFIDSHAHWILQWEYLNKSTPDEMIESVLSYGWTSISELFVNQDHLGELITLDQENRLRVRVNAYLRLNWQLERFGNWYQAYQPGQEFSANLRIGGVKIYMDRWITNWAHYFNQTELDTLVQEAHNAGFQIAIHSAVDNATDIVMNALETVLDGESNQIYRHRIEHLLLLRDDQIQRMSDLGIIASIQLPWFNSDEIPEYFFPYYENYSHLTGRFRDIVQAGIPTIGSTDFPDFPWNLGYNRTAMKTISMAVTKIGEQGLTPTDWMLNQSLTVEQALRLITIDAAYGTFQEDIKGSIKVGKLADLVILSDNPLTVSESSLANIEVLLTMVGGNIEYVKDDFDFLDITTTPAPFPLLFPIAVVISIATLVILVTFGKKLRNNNHRMNERYQVSEAE